MFTKRKVIKKNAKKSINDLECGQEDTSEKQVGIKDECKKKEEDTNNIYTQNVRRDVESERTNKEEGKGEIDKEKKKWENYNKSKKDNNNNNNNNNNQNNNNDKKKKKKITYADQKKEEEKKVNIAKTSFLIYSDNETEGDNSNNYVAIKRKKRNQRFSNYLDKLNNKETKGEERNNSRNEHMKYVSNAENWNYSNKTKCKHMPKQSFDDMERQDKENDDRKNHEQNIESSNDENDKSKFETTKKIHEHNFYLKLKDADDDAAYEEANIDVMETELIQEGNSCERLRNYGYIQVNQSLLKTEELHFVVEKNNVEKKETQNEEEQRQHEQQQEKEQEKEQEEEEEEEEKEKEEEEQGSYNIFINEETNIGKETIMVEFPDEKEETDEETKQLIEKIKIKKQILRKKNEMQSTFLNEFNDELNDAMLLSNELESEYKSTKKKKLYLTPVDIPKVSIDDDFETEDIYNYETLNEMKNRLLIKKNTNENAENIFFDSTKGTKYNTLILSGSDDENYLYEKHPNDELFEKVKIEHIISKRMMADAKNELQFYEENQKEETQETEEEKEFSETNASCNSNEHRFSSLSESPNKRSNRNGAKQKNSVYVYDSDSSNREKRYKSKRKMKAKEKSWHATKREQYEADLYNRTNEKLFEKIRKTYENKMVCSVQLVKMKKYINCLFNEYKRKQDIYNQNENNESINKEEYRRLRSLCKHQKNEVIICTIFMEFFHNMRNVIIEKVDYFHSALQVLQEMEKSFHLIYQHLKLYMYKEFYEKYKFSFTTDYIFHLKYYKNKREKKKSHRLKKLEKKKVLKQNKSLAATRTDISDKIVEQVNRIELFNNLPVLYLFDGFSSNYSSDTSVSSENSNRHRESDSYSLGAAYSSFSNYPSTEENNKDQKKKETKRKTKKQKYCQTLRMKQLKRRFLVEVNMLCRDVKPYFLNFKNVIKHFYLLKTHKEEIFRKWKCALCFEEILSFFIKWEILHWDPVFQFAIKAKQKKERILEYCKKSIKFEENWGIGLEGKEEDTTRESSLSNSVSTSSEKDECIPYLQDESDLEQSEDDSFSLVSSESSSDISSEQETENELESEEEQDKEDVEKNEGNKREADRTKENKRNLLQREDSRKGKIKKKELKKKDGNNQDNCDIEDEDIFPLFNNISFRNAKYRFRKKFFNNPSIKSFEWYKFIESIITIYDVQKEETVLKRIYRTVINKRVFELIEVWNPFSLKQSANMFVLIKEFLMYNTFIDDTEEQFSEFPEETDEKDAIEDNRSSDEEKKEIIQLKDKVKDKMKECQSVILESCKHVDTLKKKGTFLMRCLKFFKSFKNILSLLKNNELSEIVKNIYCKFVVTNYVDSVPFHNLIFASIIEILLYWNIPDDDFAAEITQQWNKISKLK